MTRQRKKLSPEAAREAERLDDLPDNEVSAYVSDRLNAPERSQRHKKPPRVNGRDPGRGQPHQQG